MPEKLRPGKFYGKVTHQYRDGGIVLSELRHNCSRKLPEHTHESAYFSLLLRGSYYEQCREKRIEYAPLTTVFHPPETTHSDEIDSDGGVFFAIELLPEWVVRSTDGLGRLPERPEVLFGSGAALAVRLYLEYREGLLSPLTVESALFDMMGDVIIPAPRANRGIPPWLRTCLEMIHDDVSQPYTVQCLARQVGIHPVHLSRVFRRRFSRSLGDYLSRLRIQKAVGKLVDPDIPLSEIALALGFADQSHFTRVFRALTGATPGFFRRRLGKAHLLGPRKNPPAAG